MEIAAVERPARRPRFRRASEPPAFRLTDDDVEIVRQVARYRLIRSTHIASLIGRSLDRTNDRLLRLFHAGYVDRPRAQLDHYPTAGSGPMVYALANQGVRLLKEKDGADFSTVEWSRKNREAGRPFIEHQIEIVNFHVALQRATRDRDDVRLVHPAEIADASSGPTYLSHNPFSLRVRLSHKGVMRHVGVVPDLVFALELADGSRRNFMVEIDRGTMPIVRSDCDQTSFARKMRVYLVAHAAKQHQRQFGWKNFRVLTVTSDANRIDSMRKALREIRVARSPGASLFLFATFDDLRVGDPLVHEWRDGDDGAARLV
jgi:Replication-relaxation